MYKTRRMVTVSNMSWVKNALNHLIHALIMRHSIIKDHSKRRMTKQQRSSERCGNLRREVFNGRIIIWVRANDDLYCRVKLQRKVIGYIWLNHANLWLKIIITVPCFSTPVTEGLCLSRQMVLQHSLQHLIASKLVTNARSAKYSGGAYLCTSLQSRSIPTTHNPHSHNPSITLPTLQPSAPRKLTATCAWDHEY